MASATRQLDPEHPDDDTLNWLAETLREGQSDKFNGDIVLTISFKTGKVISAELTRSERRHTTRAP